MYPYQSHNQVCLVHASPEVERDSAIVIFDINLLSHMWDKAVECVYCETNDHHNEKAKANGPDLSMLTMNLYCTYNNNNKKTTIIKDVGAQQFTYCKNRVKNCINCYCIRNKPNIVVWYRFIDLESNGNQIKKNKQKTENAIKWRTNSKRIKVLIWS